MVIGNPPWERMKLQEQEFFAAREPEIARAPTAHARGKMIELLKKAEPGTRERKLFEDFAIAKRIAEASSVFARESGRYALTGRGDVNTYALFAEAVVSVLNRCGRAGIVVPSGIITDVTTSQFFSDLIHTKRLVSALGFDNQRKLFPSVHPDTPFTLLTMGPFDAAPEFAAYLLGVSDLLDSRRRFTLDVLTIGRLNPNTKTAPIFRARCDADLTARVYSHVPVLVDESSGDSGNPWAFDYMTKMFDMADSSGEFRSVTELHGLAYQRTESGLLSGEGEVLAPVYEAKMIHLYDHRWATYEGGEFRDTTDEERTRSGFEIQPRYWLAADRVRERLSTKQWGHSWLLGWRDITNATNERSTVIAVYPAFAVGHTLRNAFVRVEPRLVVGFLAALSSMVVDYIARQKIGGTHLTVEILKQLPVLPPSYYSDSRLSFVAPRVLELCYTSPSVRSFAVSLGYDGPPFAWNEDRRALLRAELDAWYARAYGLTRDELRYILDPADVMGADYPSETFRVLKSNEMRKYGKYRTRDLVLEAWDRLAKAESTTQLPDQAWVMPSFNTDTVTAQLAAILKALPGPTPALKVRLAAIYALYPQYLTPQLRGTAQQEWQRLTGSRTRSAANVVNFVSRTSIEWRGAFTQLKGMGALIENTATHTWAADPAAHGYYTEGWPDGRAGFVMKAVEEIGIDAAITELPSEVQEWVREYAA